MTNWEINLPDWAKKTQSLISKLANDNVMLTLEIDRLTSCEESSYETNQKFDEWTKEFLIAEGGKKLADKFDKFIIKKMDEDDYE
jgi:hypothetical protein